MLIRYCAIIFGCLALGELIVHLTGIHFPSSIIGMILLTLFLHLGWIKLHWVKAFIVMVVTGHVYQFVRKRTKHHHENENI